MGASLPDRHSVRPCTEEGAFGPVRFSRPSAHIALPAWLILALVACESGTSPEEAVRLEYPPTDLHRVIALQPLGNLNVLPEDHGGLYTPLEDRGQAPTIPVYAPADGRITELGHFRNESLAPFETDVHVRIRVGPDVQVTYAHMSDFSPEIWDAAGELALGRTSVNIPVTAGQVIGYAGTSGTIDWHITDQRLRLNFENPSRYPGEWLYAGCVYDYYDEPLRSQIRELSLRTTEPRCGKIDYDVAGRIVGNWFLEGEVPPAAFDDYSTHLAIVYDEFDGDRIAISDGIAIRPDSPHEGDDVYFGARVFWVGGNAPRPEDVGVADGLVKYEIMDRLGPGFFGEVPTEEPEVVGVFLMQMLTSDRIQVERVMNVTAADVDDFGGGSRVYVR